MDVYITYEHNRKDVEESLRRSLYDLRKSYAKSRGQDTGILQAINQLTTRLHAVETFNQLYNDQVYYTDIRINLKDLFVGSTVSNKSMLAIIENYIEKLIPFSVVCVFAVINNDMPHFCCRIAFESASDLVGYRLSHFE